MPFREVVNGHHVAELPTLRKSSCLGIALHDLRTARGGDS